MAIVLKLKKGESVIWLRPRRFCRRQVAGRMAQGRDVLHRPAGVRHQRSHERRASNRLARRSRAVPVLHLRPRGRKDRPSAQGGQAAAIAAMTTASAAGSFEVIETASNSPKLPHRANGTNAMLPMIPYNFEKKRCR